MTTCTDRGQMHYARATHGINGWTWDCVYCDWTRPFHTLDEEDE